MYYKPPETSPSPLTRRQVEVLNCLVAASDQNEAAAWLGITPTQIGRQKSKITERLGAENFLQATIVAYQIGLIDPKALPLSAPRPQTT